MIRENLILTILCPRVEATQGAERRGLFVSIGNFLKNGVSLKNYLFNPFTLYFYLFFIGYFAYVLIHETIHLEIDRLFAIEILQISYNPFNAFVVSESSNQAVIFLHALNEILGYNLILFYFLMVLVVLSYHLIKLGYYNAK